MSTFHGGATCCGLKLMHLLVDSSYEAEAVATGKAGELLAHHRNILRAMGIPPDGPTFVGTDNSANALVASGRSLPSRARHCLRRYLTFLQRVAAKEATVGHVPDAEMPADFMTKWVSAAKLLASLAYATNAKNRVTR